MCCFSDEFVVFVLDKCRCDCIYRNGSCCCADGCEIVGVTSGPAKLKSIIFSAESNVYVVKNWPVSLLQNGKSLSSLWHSAELPGSQKDSMK